MASVRLVSLALLLSLPAASVFADDRPDVSFPVPDFELTERSGRTVRRADLLGKVWLGSFVVTRCPDGLCPAVTRTMERLQERLKNRPAVRLVTFTADPERDKLEDLNHYAEVHHADPDRWLFLTGSEGTVERLQESLYLVKRDGANPTPHSQRIIVVDREGNMRGFYLGLPRRGPDAEQAEREFEADLKRLVAQVESLSGPELPAWAPRDFPAFNATLNALAGALLLLGYTAIRQRWVRLHVTCMLLAILVSAVFLASYLFYHIAIKQGQPTRFADQAPGAPAWVGWLYLAILGTHTVLAIPVAPLAVWAAWLGLRNRLQKHVWLARWVFPAWLYVSVTGVVVYWMLYRLYPSP